MRTDRICGTGYRPRAQYRDQSGRNRPQLRGLFPGARKRAGCNPATAAVSSDTDVDSPARGLTFSAMTPNAVKRRRFRTKRDWLEKFLRIREICEQFPCSENHLRRALLSSPAGNQPAYTVHYWLAGFSGVFGCTGNGRTPACHPWRSRVSHTVRPSANSSARWAASPLVHARRHGDPRVGVRQAY
jgi:hypothetical protein